ncbi:MAG: EscU/YscU/HrcU family type III secretion system export apparatus switch protein [Gemmatimonadetes bacterium]|nr:MAG: EscU/YscU/HrcU family type III secretion system export apparatus switch protein [Gemmatimonadota bacterium]
MADDFQERNEAPTPKRRREAREKGQIPRSQEVTTAFLLLGAALVLRVGAAPVAASLVALFGNTTLSALALDGTPDGVTRWLEGVGWSALGALAPVTLSMAGMAVAITAIQARGVLSFEPLKPQWSKLNPQKNASRLWGWKAPMEAGKSLAKLAVVALAAYLALARAATEFPSLAQRSPRALLEGVQTYAVRLLVWVGLAYLIIALADYAFQLWQHEKSLRMSREEIKREHKETDGDPNVKARRRSMARSLARRRMLLSVSEADVVVTNPTHIAVALKYDMAKADAPIILAMGERKVAKRIKQLAMDAGVPVIENKPLARALFATGKIGFPIPVELYVAVAEVLAFVFRQRRERRLGWQGSSVV